MDNSDIPPRDQPEPHCPRCDGYMTWVQKDYCFVCENAPSVKDAKSGDYTERPDGTLQCVGVLEEEDLAEYRSCDEEDSRD